MRFPAPLSLISGRRSLSVTARKFDQIWVEKYGGICSVEFDSSQAILQLSPALCLVIRLKDPEYPIGRSLDILGLSRRALRLDAENDEQRVP